MRSCLVGAAVERETIAGAVGAIVDSVDCQRRGGSTAATRTRPRCYCCGGGQTTTIVCSPQRLLGLPLMKLSLFLPLFPLLLQGTQLVCRVPWRRGSVGGGGWVDGMSREIHGRRFHSTMTSPVGDGGAAVAATAATTAAAAIVESVAVNHDQTTTMFGLRWL